MEIAKGRKEYLRGCKAAQKSIHAGKDVKDLLDQSKSDLDKDAFYRGWRDTCKKELDKINSKVVYVRNYKNFITIMRHADGSWHYNYTPERVIEEINKRCRAKGLKTYTFNRTDVFGAATIFGWRLCELIRESKISYGDDPDKD